MNTFNTLNIAIIGAFMMEGMRDLSLSLPPIHYETILDAWDQGALELVREMVYYAEFVEQQHQAHDDADPGAVFDYVVSNRFGMWFGRRIAEHDAPTEDECKAEIIRLVGEWLGEI
jgi:hypothetical protein